MPQISVYIDEPTLRKIEIAAKRQKKIHIEMGG
jgi:hypothetical protein